MTEADAKRLAADILLSQSIGITGYLYCLDSRGVLKVHPKESLRDTDISSYGFVQEQIHRKEGYLEYDWKNPDDDEIRPKALYMTYFAAMGLDHFRILISERILHPGQCG